MRYLRFFSFKKYLYILLYKFKIKFSLLQFNYFACLTYKRRIKIMRDFLGSQSFCYTKTFQNYVFSCEGNNCLGIEQFSKKSIFNNPPFFPSSKPIWLSINLELASDMCTRAADPLRGRGGNEICDLQGAGLSYLYGNAQIGGHFVVHSLELEV